MANRWDKFRTVGELQNERQGGRRGLGPLSSWIALTILFTLVGALTGADLAHYLCRAYCMTNFMSYQTSIRLASPGFLIAIAIGGLIGFLAGIRCFLREWRNRDE